MTAIASHGRVAAIGGPEWIDEARFRVAYDAFPQAFLEAHPGYERIRPALQPIVLPQRLVDDLTNATRHVLQELRRLPLERQGYSDEELTWLTAMTTEENLDTATLFARADFVLGADGPRMVEINVSPTIGGIGILDRYAEVFAAEAAHLIDPRLSMPSPAAAWARALQRTAGAQRRNGVTRMALVVADDEVTVPHPFEAAHYLHRHGVDAVVVTVDDIRFEGRRAFARGTEIELLYGCYTYDQMAAPRCRTFVDQAVECCARGGPRYLAPPVFTFFGNKAALSQLDDADGVMLLARTRVVQHDACPSPDDRARFVLKPAIGLGGEGVILGASCSRGEWERAVDTAASGQRLHVLQDYVAPIRLMLPTSRGEAAFDVGIGCLFFDGEPAGFLLRHVPAGRAGAINCKQGATFAAPLIGADA